MWINTDKCAVWSPWLGVVNSYYIITLGFNRLMILKTEQLRHLLFTVCVMPITHPIINFYFYSKSSSSKASSWPQNTPQSHFLCFILASHLQSGSLSHPVLALSLSVSNVSHDVLQGPLPCRHDLPCWVTCQIYEWLHDLSALAQPYMVDPVSEE